MRQLAELAAAHAGSAEGGSDANNSQSFQNMCGFTFPRAATRDELVTRAMLSKRIMFTSKMASRGV